MTPSVFISHSWNDSRKYRDTIALIDRSLDGGWENNSIPEDRAIALATGGESELTQRRELIEASHAAACSRLKIVDNALRQLESSLEELKRQRPELLSLLDAPWNLEAARIALFDSDQKPRIKLYQERVEQGKKRDIPGEVNRLNSEIAKLHLTVQKKRNRSLELNIDIGRYQASIDRKDFVLLEKRDLQRDQIARKFPNLANAIHQRIAISDVVFILFEKNTPFRVWMEFEYQDAYVQRKPMYAVIHPDGPKIVPADIRSFGVGSIEWSEQKVSNTIRHHSGSFDFPA